jgi:hypothetical protein
MFGTNDTSATGFFAFERNLRADIDALLGLGVVPLVSTIPPRGDSTAADALVPEMNAVIRALAQARQLPLMDLHATLVGLPDYGMSPDGVHPQAYRSPSGVRPCWFTPEALQKGMNQRNLLVLTALDRVRRMVLEGEPAEAAPPALAGDGTLASPFVIPELPFVDDNDTSKSQGRALDVYDCAAQDESGPEIVYRLILSAPARLRARVFVDDGVDVDLHWLDGPTADRCLARADKTLELEADAGEYWLVADSYVSGGQVKAGSYRLTVVELP